MVHCVYHGGPRRKNRGDWEWLGHSQVIGNVTIRQRAYDFLFAFHRNYIWVKLVPFSRYSKLFGESYKFFIVHVYLAPQLDVTPLEFHQDVSQNYSS